MQSDDIRSQLPQESKRFECADGEWRDMMYGAQAQPNVVEACHAEGREELLNKLRESIETCEKALGGMYNDALNVEMLAGFKVVIATNSTPYSTRELTLKTVLKP